jgi:hypothetical protein
MSMTQSDPTMVLDRECFGRAFGREPFGFTHNLDGLDLFEFDSLRGLAGKYRDDSYVAAGAPSPGTVFYSLPEVRDTPREALDRLESGNYRVLLKRPEKYDPRFKALLDRLFKQIVDLRGGLGRERVVRLESAILISSAATMTPFHFDPEIGFFSQIEGEKIYHVYSPSCLREEELERFYVRGATNIGQVDLEGRDPSREHVFALGPGKGLHQPKNAPHWVETRGTRSVSYTVVFETDATRATDRVRAFNYGLRKLGLHPASPGSSPGREAVKAAAMGAVLPVGKRVRRTILKALGRY